MAIKRITAPDEVIVSQSFAGNAFGEENPIGQVIRQETEAANPSDLMVYKIVNVALTEEKDFHGKRSIVIFPCPQNPVLHSASDHVSPDKPRPKA